MDFYEQLLNEFDEDSLKNSGLFYFDEKKRSKLSPTLVHGKYLISLGSPDKELLQKSSLALSKEFSITNKIGALGLVFHPASHRGVGFKKIKNQFVDAVNQTLLDNKGESLLLLETSAGSGDHIGSNFNELAELINLIDNKRIGICIDTQHLWASGYDISSHKGLEKTFEDFDQIIGIEKLKAIHLNDSKKEFRSFVDRHGRAAAKQDRSHGRTGEGQPRTKETG